LVLMHAHSSSIWPSVQTILARRPNTSTRRCPLPCRTTLPGNCFRRAALDTEASLPAQHSQCVLVLSVLTCCLMFTTGRCLLFGVARFRCFAIARIRCLFRSVSADVEFCVVRCRPMFEIVRRLASHVCFGRSLFEDFGFCFGVCRLYRFVSRVGAVWKRARSHPGEWDREKKMPLSRFVLVWFVAWLVPTAPHEPRTDIYYCVCVFGCFCMCGGLFVWLCVYV
jgi:hypothetical protein